MILQTDKYLFIFNTLITAINTLLCLLLPLLWQLVPLLWLLVPLLLVPSLLLLVTLLLVPTLLSLIFVNISSSIYLIDQELEFLESYRLAVIRIKKKKCSHYFILGHVGIDLSDQLSEFSKIQFTIGGVVKSLK